ncbi:MAG: MG2 domain-containing protein [Candidatus Cyclobacteriaceae bacterium M2_1C_046]
MKIIKNLTISITSVLLLVLLSFTPFNNPLERIIEGFDRYLEELPQEKVYLHFDRPYYSSGETIWYKAYLTAGAFHVPSSLSKTIYVELIDEEGKLIKQHKLLSINGSSAGDFQLPDTLRSGNYLVRAYTQWMKNFDQDYFFHQQVKIWKPENTITKANDNYEGQTDIRFYPEGGEMVNGIQSKVAFKAVGPDGLSRVIEGKIVDDSGTVISEIESNILGMGAFSFIPQEDRSYFAIVEGREIALPKAKDYGLVMGVTNISGSDELLLGVQTTDHTKYKDLYIVAQTRGVVCYAARTELTSNYMRAAIPKSKFPAGVAQITIIDHTGLPVAERLIFIDKNEGYLNVEVAPDKATYQPREKVTLDIQVKNANGEPVVTDLSLAVRDDSQVLTDENRETIKSYLLLSSELKGHIESPGYYFNEENENREEALDHLLLTQGWRRFSFAKAVESELDQPEYTVEKGLTIKGKLQNKYNEKPVEDGKVTFVSYYPITNVLTASTKESGEFEIHPVIYFDSAEVVLTGENKRGRKNNIAPVVYEKPEFPEVEFPQTPLNETQSEFERNYIAKSIERRQFDMAFDEKTIMLSEIAVKGKRDNFDDLYSSSYGRGSVYNLVEDDPGLQNMVHPLQLIQGRVAGVQVVGGGNNWEVLIRGVSSILAGTEPLIMVDDIPVPLDMLNGIDVQDIKGYRIWKGPETAVFGSRGANGVIGFYTKRGYKYSKPQEGVITFTDNGYQLTREFYAPKYDVKKPEHAKPDIRATLFWAPYIQTDSTGRASVTFYNHDLETSVTGIVEGLSVTGIPGSANFSYEIKEIN